MGEEKCDSQEFFINGLSYLANCKSMKDAITGVPTSQSNTLNSWRKFFIKSSATVLKPERVHQISYRGVANLMHLSLALT